MDHDRHRAGPIARILLLSLIALGLLGAAPPDERFSAEFMARAIASSGWYEIEACPESDVAERSVPGCARIPAPIDTAVTWLDLLEREVFEQTRREGDWLAQGTMRYTTWRLEPTGQRYLLVLAPHPHRSVTILYVSELSADTVAALR